MIVKELTDDTEIAGRGTTRLLNRETHRGLQGSTYQSRRDRPFYSQAGCRFLTYR